MNEDVKGIKVIGPVLLSPDGYGEMARQLCAGIIEYGYTGLTISPLNFNREPDLDKIADEYKIMQPYIDNQIEYDVVLQCLTADNFPVLREEGKINVGYTMWETTGLPAHWVDLCNKMDKIIVPAQFSVETFKSSGVTVPIDVLPIPTDVNKFDNVVVNKDFKDLLGDRMVFYSIFQWSERKNPTALLDAYYSSFGSEDDVILVLKSHINGNGDIDRLEIENRVKGIRNNIKRNTNDYPKVIIIADPLSSEQMCQLHKSADIYIAPVRGEGFGIPIFDAMLCGNHVIATKFSSYLDFSETYWRYKFDLYDLIDCQLEHVHSQPGPLYTSDQKWASINTYELSECMKTRYGQWLENNKKLPYQTHRNDYSDYLKKQYSRKVLAKLLITGERD